MSLPVSQYEALLLEVRGLRQRAQRVQQLAKPLLSGADYSSASSSYRQNGDLDVPLDYTMESLLLDRQHNTCGSSNYDRGVSSSVEGDTTCSEDECGGARSSSTHLSVSSEPVAQRSKGMSSLYHGTWPVERTMWNSEPARIGSAQQNAHHNNMQEVNSVMSFASSSGGVPLDRVLGSPDRSRRSSQQLEAKVDMVYSLLAMLGGQEHADMGETLLALSTNPESCLAMRQSGCIPLLVQLVQSDRDADTRRKATQALNNLVNSQPDEKIRKRETRILKLLDQTRAYTEALRTNTDYEPEPNSSSEDEDKHPVQTIAHIMKLSFDEGHRQAICQLGGIYAIATLVEAEHTLHGSTTNETHCILMRRYACMALTNLTFGDSGNKALLCSFREFMRALVVQLQSPSDELRQVTASVLRNLSWRADSTSKDILREVGSVTGLMKSAMLDNKENTLKSILSALWNLSAHCTENKSEICAVDGALGFLVDMLTYKTPSKSLAIIENSGGILRNISSQIAVRDDYREVLRKHNCLQILLDQLKSPSLTIVSNACGTLWNLSAKCGVDQETLWQMGAPTMLRSLNHSKHKMIAMGSSAALKNLLSARPQQTLYPQLDSTSLALELPALPTLGARKQKNLLRDLDQNLSETYENIEKDSPTKLSKDDKYVPTNDFLHKSKQQSIASPDFLLSSSESDGLNNAFASLNLNEPSTSFSSAVRSKSRIPTTNYGSTSLPYSMTPPQKRTAPCTYIPVRNKFSDCGYEDEIEVSDQPIDYSRKYSETKLPNNDAKSMRSSSKDRKSNYSYPKTKTEEESFSMYAETDLDQPTDYSLRYAEDDSDSDVCDKMSKGEGTEYVQDTVKTYCTEGTPYQTPFNFSTATSMSDLRIDEKQVIDNDKQTNSPPKSKEINKHLDEKDHCSTEDISDIDNRPKESGKIPKSEFSSGLMSPEKPVNYCEEGTPGYFSRVSSFGSLNSIPVNETIKNEPKEKSPSPSPLRLDTEHKLNEKPVQKSPPETKAVKFEQVVNYAEETPLMFSRSSSLASLDSIDQHSIPDDKSSVISDFSRLTSGIVSPSELPDSPTQIVPPSPRPRKTPLEFPSTSKTKHSADGRPLPAPRNLGKTSVFEDNITKFKEESTPIQFSTATSLSSLTIDDHDDGEASHMNQPKPQLSQEDNTLQKLDEQAEKQDSEKEANTSDVNDDLAQESDDGDEDILAACISDGMQTSRQIPTSPPSSSPATSIPITTFKYQQKPAHTGIPLPRSSPRAIPVSNTMRTHNMAGDGVRTYYTEDTPAHLSRAGSNSDLSNLSIPNDNKSRHGYLSDESSSNFSGDNDNILAECIQSAMPKAKKDAPKSITPSKPMSCLPRRSTPIKYNANAEGNVRRDRSNEAGKVENKESDRKGDARLPPYLTTKDELESYAVENSPCHFSLRSSLSDLTVDGSVAGLTKSCQPNNQLQSSKVYSNISSFTSQQTENLNISEENNTSHREQSRRESLSSISVESLGSLEAEQALLEQCISSGMPKNTNRPVNKPLEVPAATKPIGIATKQFYRKPKDEEAEDPNDKPKNVNVASAAGNTATRTNGVCPDMSTAVAGVEKSPELGCGKDCNSRLPSPPEKNGTPAGTSPDRCLPTEGISSTGLTKSGSNKSLEKLLGDPLDTITIEYTYSNSDNCTNYGVTIESCLARSCEESGKLVDNRMLDPDAMIESLDRFTAELVSQASHLNKDDDKYKVSADNTWSEDTSPNEVTFPSISGSTPNVITFKSDEEVSNKVEIDIVDGLFEDQEVPSNDFSSINTSTMTESTLIAIEASKMATVFKKEAEMSQSITSVASLELDQVQPPSQLHSLTNSTVGLDKIVPKSPKLGSRKKSLPAGLMIRRALSNSLNHGSSAESLSNLDHMNPPSDLKDVFDMEGSTTSIQSIPNDTAEFKTDFVINGVTHKDIPAFEQHNPIFNVKSSTNILHLSSNLTSFSDLDNMNPPSLFNEITDMCNSLADVATEAICSETEVYEDCYSHVKTEEEFSDANSLTPLHSDVGSSSAESTPRKAKSLNKSLTSKQKRNLARDRYKTYTVAAEMVMRAEQKKIEEQAESVSEDSKTKEDCKTENETVSYSSSTYTRKSSEKLTPKERRRSNRSRFETQVLDEAITSILQQPVVETPAKSESCDSSNCSSAQQSPSRTKLSIRRSFMQKRLENKDRFKTQTLNESSFSPEVSSASPPLINGETDLHLLVQKEADLVLKSLRETKTNHDELLDCETLSLVSNDDDSEHNSGCSVNYRTYHKSWGFRRNDIPVIESEQQNDLVNCQESNLSNDLSSLPGTNDEHSDNSEDENEIKPTGKPKIVKPNERQVESSDDTVNEEQIKGIRGRRKPLYSKANLTGNKIGPKNIKPIKTMTSNLVKNVTSSLKSGTALRSVVSKQSKTVIAKPPMPQTVKPTTNGYGHRQVSTPASPKTSPARTPAPKYSPKHSAKPTPSPKGTPPLERQGTFTKDDINPQLPTKSKIPTPASTKIPTFASKIARAVTPATSKIPSINNNIPPMRNGTIKSASADRANKNTRIYNRSTSADSRETSIARRLQSSSSSQSLKSDSGKSQNGAVKRASAPPHPGQKTSSSSSLNSNNSAKKQVTSKIANLWKKIEESKNKAPKVDTRVWIQPEAEPESPRLIRSDTFGDKDEVVLRNKNGEDNTPKRVSRLGSFIVMDENEEGIRLQQAISEVNGR